MLLVVDEPLADDAERGAEQREREPECQAEVLRLVLEVVERVDGDEAGRRARCAEQQREDEPFGAWIGLPRLDEPLRLRDQRPALLPPQQQDPGSDRPPLQRVHRTPASSAGPAAAWPLAFSGRAAMSARPLARHRKRRLRCAPSSRSQDTRRPGPPPPSAR